ncbi:radical SAM domain protein [Desulfosarcina variabilis str. Montpellier]|uniref:radical SAM protein n=1 Tax=Desulfosarcina variabilis TaxID=2300 RepID=UPI003AFAF85C
MAIRYLILSLTSRCNLRCVYCYNGEGNGKTVDMPEAVIAQAIQEVASQKEPFHLQLTGGEPTLVAESIEKALVLAYDTGRCRSLGIQTNATCLTPDLLRLFKTHDVQVGVSLDGPPAIHQQQRGMAAETLRGLQMLEAAGIPFRVTTVVTQTNADALDRLVLTLAGFGCARGIGLDLLVGKGRAGAFGAVAPADASTLEKGLFRMLDVLADVNRCRSLPIRLREQDLIVGKTKKKPVFCHACRGESLAVDPDGGLYPCGQTLGDETFSAGTIWQPQYDRLTSLREFKPLGVSCNSCDIAAVCPGDCPSRLYYNRKINADLICTVYRTIDNGKWRMKN